MSKRRMVGDVLEISANDGTAISIREKADENGLLLRVSGPVRNELAHDFEDELMTAFSVADQVLLDLSEVAYIGSFAMKALLSVQQIIDENEEKRLKIVALSGEVKNVFEEAGFLEIFEIETADGD